MSHKALVLGGGALKGCYQAGAVKAVFESGFIPDIIYGVSVGALNGAFITNRAGNIFKTKKSLTPQDWLTIGNDLQNFWFTEITQPSDIAIKRSFLSDVVNSLFNNFKGLADMSPIDQKVNNELYVPDMVQSPCKFIAGTVDFISGNMIYASPGDDDFLSYVKGSLAAPVAMPAWISAKGEVLFDGGTRDVAPLGYAINEGADNIIGIVCQAYNLAAAPGFNVGDLMQLANRIEDIIINQNVQNDSQWIQFINDLLTEVQSKNYKISALQTYKLINHLLIQPAQDLDLDILDFDSTDIETNFNLGYETAKAKLAGYTPTIAPATNGSSSAAAPTSAPVHAAPATIATSN